MTRIIIVDDEPHITRVLKLALDRVGYDVLTCRNGVEALNAIRDCAPEILITDIQMPQMTGKELCMKLHDEFPLRSFPIFVMTSMTDREHREWSAQLANVFFLEKPLSMRILLQQLEVKLREQRTAGGVA